MFTKSITSVLVAAAAMGLVQSAAVAQNGEPFKLGAEQNSYAQPAGYPAYPAYPAPKMVPQQPQQAPQHHQKPIKAGVQATQQSHPIQAGINQNQRPPMQAQTQMAPPGVLPQQFLGQWMVMGSRSKVQCRPEYQSGIDNIFTSTNSQMWNITGNPGSYTMGSDTGVTSVQVSQANQTMAWIRYQHPVKNTVAREAIVMELSPDGRSFNGIQRITILKQGEPSPRAEVTYNLSGTRR